MEWHSYEGCQFTEGPATNIRERSGSVVECLTRDRGAAGLSLTSVTALSSLSKTHYPSLVLVQPRKTFPCLTERLLMGCKESNQTKTSYNQASGTITILTFMSRISTLSECIKESYFFSVLDFMSS